MQSSDCIQWSWVMEWSVLVLSIVLGGATYALYHLVDRLRNKP